MSQEYEWGNSYPTPESAELSFSFTVNRNPIPLPQTGRLKLSGTVQVENVAVPALGGGPLQEADLTSAAEALCTWLRSLDWRGEDAPMPSIHVTREARTRTLIETPPPPDES